MPEATAGRSSSKRPRSSSSTPSDTPLRKRRRASSTAVAASPLIRSIKPPSPIPRKLPATAAPPPPPTPPSPPPPPPLVPKQGARLSPPPPEPDNELREGSVGSTSSEDAADFEELIADGLSYQEALLFRRIQRRGLEPLMPAHWQVDFSTLPDDLFSAAGDQAHIEAVTLDGTFNATTAFQALVNLGAVVRGRLEGKQEVESKILLGLRKYGLGGWDIEPFIAISSSQGDSIRCQERMQKKLLSLAATIRAQDAQATEDPPDPELSSTVYGLAIAGCVTALTTLESRSPKAQTRTMLVVDFSHAISDFWNAVAISLLVISARTDEIQRAKFYKARDIKKPLHDSYAWRWGRAKNKGVESDEDA